MFCLQLGRKNWPYHIIVPPSSMCSSATSMMIITTMVKVAATVALLFHPSRYAALIMLNGTHRGCRTVIRTSSRELQPLLVSCLSATGITDYTGIVETNSRRLQETSIVPYLSGGRPSFQFDSCKSLQGIHLPLQ